MTFVAACHDVLRVTRGHLGISHQGDLKPILQKAEGFSQRLGEVWTGRLQAYREMKYDHRVVIYDERYASTDDVHINQVECLFSLVKPWLRKLHDLSKRGSEQAAYDFGTVRSLNLVDASLEIVTDCLVTRSLHGST